LRLLAPTPTVKNKLCCHITLTTSGGDGHVLQRSLVLPPTFVAVQDK
jgi:hypothetical protein